MFSLEPKVDDDGVTFRSTYDGSTHRFTPEAAVRVQEQLGADIQMVLDVCPPLPSPPDVVELAVKRTALWAARARSVSPSAPTRRCSGSSRVARARSCGGRVPSRPPASTSTATASAGCRSGETRAEMLPALAAALEPLPADRPRYLMGVGDPASLVEAIALGVDQFDCVLQTRLGRHGTALTSTGKVQVKAARHGDEDVPVDDSCSCAVCARHSRGYLRHLFSVAEPSAARLLTLHNVAWTLQLMAAARSGDRRRSASPTSVTTCCVCGDEHR